MNENTELQFRRDLIEIMRVQTEIIRFLRIVVVPSIKKDVLIRTVEAEEDTLIRTVEALEKELERRNKK